MELLSQLCCARTLVALYPLYGTVLSICLLYVPCASPTTTVHLLYLIIFPVYSLMYIPNVLLYALLYPYMSLVHSLTSLYANYIPLYVLLLSPGCLLCPLHPRRFRYVPNGQIRLPITANQRADLYIPLYVPLHPIVCPRPTKCPLTCPYMSLYPPVCLPMSLVAPIHPKKDKYYWLRFHTTAR